MVRSTDRNSSIASRKKAQPRRLERIDSTSFMHVGTSTVETSSLQVKKTMRFSTRNSLCTRSETVWHSSWESGRIYTRPRLSHRLLVLPLLSSHNNEIVHSE